MNIELASDQQSFLADLVATGRFGSVGEAVREGVQLLKSREDFRKEIQVGIDQADRGEVMDHDTIFSQLRRISN